MEQKGAKFRNYVGATLKRLVLLPQAKRKFRGKKVWLVCERGNDARDNGYHMFKYLRKEHPEIEAWYVITPDSVDLPKIKDLGNIAYFGSKEHWMAYICAEKILTAFEPHFCPSESHRFYKETKRKNRQSIVFLQHGVIGNDLPLYHRERSHFEMFVCGAKPEYDFVCAHFNYRNGEVKYTGLARFDALHNVQPKTQVLIMPTYRKWFRDRTEQEIAQSEYVRRWQALLVDPRLTAYAEQHQTPIIFYPHQLMQQYVGMFSSPSKWIVIADCKRYDVQPLLMESALLVTDYSSVHFDFAYMNKPVLYYQFDEQEVFSRHVERGYYDYRTMGFGEVESDQSSLLTLIGEYMENGCRLKPEYTKRIDGFFPLHDAHNCERIYNEICSL